MTSFLLVSTNQVAIDTAVLEICSEKQINALDKTVFDLTMVESKTGVKKSWGIDDIKMMQKKICLKPLRGTWKAVIIKDAELLTIEAQNALLKTLEEPPDGTLLLLTASGTETFLPTVLSRCAIKRVGEKEELLQEIIEERLSDLREINNASVGLRLKKAEQLSRSKEELLFFLRSCLIALHRNITENSSAEDILRLKLLHQHYKLLKNSNTNIRMATEHLFLAFPSTRA